MFDVFVKEDGVEGDGVVGSDEGDFVLLEW